MLIKPVLNVRIFGIPDELGNSKLLRQDNFLNGIDIGKHFLTVLNSQDSL